MSEVIEELMIEWTKQNADVLTELIEPEETPSPSKGKGGKQSKPN